MAYNLYLKEYYKYSCDGKKFFSPKAKYGFVLVTAIEFILTNYKPFYVIFVVLNVREKIYSS